MGCVANDVGTGYRRPRSGTSGATSAQTLSVRRRVQASAWIIHQRVPDLSTLAAVFGLSAAKFMMGVALGASLRLPFASQFLATGAGGVAGVLLTAYAGDAIRAFVRRRFPRKVQPRAENDAQPVVSLAERVWDRWGLVGLALVGTVTLGPIIAVVTALSLGAPRARVVAFMSAAVVGWSLLFGAVSSLAPGLLPNRPARRQGSRASGERGVLVAEQSRAEREGTDPSGSSGYCGEITLDVRCERRVRNFA